MIPCMYTSIYFQNGAYLKYLFRVLLHDNVRSTCFMFVHMSVSTTTIQQEPHKIMMMKSKSFYITEYKIEKSADGGQSFMQFRNERHV